MSGQGSAIYVVYPPKQCNFLTTAGTAFPAVLAHEIWSIFTITVLGPAHTSAKFVFTLL